MHKPLRMLQPAWCLAWGLALALLTTAAPPAAAADSERARLAQLRKQLSEAFSAEERACTQRFAVTSCVEAVRLRRRDVLAPLRERELQLDEAERLQRATDRRAALELKRAAAAAASVPASAVTPELRVRPTAPAPSRPASGLRDHSEERAAQAEQRQHQALQRREEAAAAQQRVQRRQDERKASGRQAAPLPVPSGASASASSSRR